MEGVATSAEEWETLVSDSFVPLAVNRFHPSADGFAGRVNSRAIGSGATVNRVSADGSTLQRDLRRRTPRTEDPSLLFVIHRSGIGRVEQYGRKAQQAPGDFVIYLSDTPYTLDFPSAMDELVVHVPLSGLTTPRKQLAELCAQTFVADAAVRATMAYADTLLHTADDDPRLSSLAATINYLVDSSLCGYLSMSVVNAPDDILRTRAEKFIDTHAHNPTLTPDEVARALSISRRRLYQVFEGASAPAARIREARIARATASLAYNPHQPVTALWSQTGFQDQRTFLRAFTAQTGTTPSEYRETIRAGLWI